MTATQGLVRRALPEESQLLSELAFRSKSHWGYPDDFLEACRADLTLTPEYVETHPVFVFDIEGSLIGFYALVPAPDQDVTLDYLYVDSCEIGKGFGKRLWLHSLEMARRMGYRSLFLSADPNAEPFYLAMGAERIKELPSTVQPGRMLPFLRVVL